MGYSHRIEDPPSLRSPDDQESVEMGRTNFATGPEIARIIDEVF